MKITKNTKISKLISENSEAAGILFEKGFHCVGCPMASQETIEQGCLAHGFNEKEIDKLIEELNQGDSNDS